MTTTRPPLFTRMANVAVMRIHRCHAYLCVVGCRRLSDNPLLKYRPARSSRLALSHPSILSCSHACMHSCIHASMHSFVHPGHPGSYPITPAYSLCPHAQCIMLDAETHAFRNDFFSLLLYRQRIMRSLKHSCPLRLVRCQSIQSSRIRVK